MVAAFCHKNQEGMEDSNSDQDSDSIQDSDEEGEDLDVQSLEGSVCVQDVCWV